MAIINEGTIAKLRRLAASWQVFNIKMHQYHYNVVGETFDELHKLFKELYEEAVAQYEVPLRYVDQCCICNRKTGKVTSWVPSCEDIFAEDWYRVR